MDWASEDSMQSPLHFGKLILLLSLILCGCFTLSVEGQIRIHEILSSNATGFLDEDGDSSDWIELSNVGMDPIQLKGFSLSDDINEPGKWLFSDHLMLPKSHLVVFASGKNRSITLAPTIPSLDASDWPSLSIWLAADQASLQHKDEESYVAEWRNQLPNSWSLGATNVEHQPRWLADELNGQPVVRFDRPIQELRASDIASSQIARTDSMTLFVLQRYRPPRHNGSSIRFITKRGDGFNLLALWSNGAMYFDFGNIDLQGRLASAPPKAFTDHWRLITATRHHDGTTTLHVNGTLIATGRLKAPFAPDMDGALVIGDFDFNGDLAEIIGFKDALNSQQRVHIESYLSKKYKLSYKGSYFHTNFKINSKGESIQLYSPDEKLIDQAPPFPLPTDVSLGKVEGNLNEWQLYPRPTPNENNTTESFTAHPSPVEFSHDPGFYTEPISLQLTHPDPMVIIRYTTDGSIPKETSPMWSNNLVLPDGNQIPSRWALIPTNPSRHQDQHSQYTMPEDKRDLFGWLPPKTKLFRAVTVRARAFKAGALPGDTKTGTYFITTGGTSRYSLPVVSLNIEPSEWFDEREGLYVAGKNYDSKSWQENFWGTGNYFQKGRFSERVGYLEFFKDGQRTFRGNIGLKIHGGGSRAQPQKSLRMIARNAIGPGSFSFFPGKADRAFSQLTLRNAGQDSILHTTMLRDTVIQSLSPQNSITQETHPVIVFLNGEYWGLHYLQEHFNDDDLKERFELSNADLDLLEVNAVPKHGNASAYSNLIATARDAATGDSSALKEIRDQLDQDNFIDHYLTQIYFDNVDWPGNNIAYFRALPKGDKPSTSTMADGKWRWLTYGVEAGMGMNGDIHHNAIRRLLDLDFADGSAAPWSTELFRTLVRSEDFRHSLLNRFAGLLNTRFATDNVLKVIEEKQSLIVNEIEEHLNRWRRPASLNEWHENIKVLHEFAMERPSIQEIQWLEAFNIPRMIQIQLRISPQGGGDIKIHRTTIGNHIQSKINNDSNWTGRYFEGIPLELKARPSEGYEFVKWDGDIQSEKTFITLVPGSDQSMTARFRKVQSVPSPSITVENAQLVLSFKLDKGQEESDYHWESSTDLSIWSSMNIGRVIREVNHLDQSVKVSRILPNLPKQEESLFFRIVKRVQHP